MSALDLLSGTFCAIVLLFVVSASLSSDGQFALSSDSVLSIEIVDPLTPEIAIAVSVVGSTTQDLPAAAGDIPWIVRSTGSSPLAQKFLVDIAENQRPRNARIRVTWADVGVPTASSIQVLVMYDSIHSGASKRGTYTVAPAGDGRFYFEWADW